MNNQFIENIKYEKVEEKIKGYIKSKRIRIVEMTKEGRERFGVERLIEEIENEIEYKEEDIIIVGGKFSIIGLKVDLVNRDVKDINGLKYMIDEVEIMYNRCIIRIMNIEYEKKGERINIPFIEYELDVLGRGNNYVVNKDGYVMDQKSIPKKTGIYICKDSGSSYLIIPIERFKNGEIIKMYI